jgi:hypothetical protein
MYNTSDYGQTIHKRLNWRTFADGTQNISQGRNIRHDNRKKKNILSLIHILRSILIDVMGTGGHVRIGIPGQNNKTNKQTNKQTLIFLFVFLAISPIYTSGIPLVASLSLALQSGIFKKKSTLN